VSLEILKNKPAARICIILFGAIGDVVRGLSLSTRIKKHCPEAEIIWGVEKTSSALLQAHPSINQLLVFDRKKGFLEYLSFLKRIRALKCDIVLDLSRHLKGGICSIASGAPTRIGFNRTNSREGNWFFQTNHIPPVPHFSDKMGHFQKFADILGIEKDEKTDFGFQVSEAEKEAIEGKITELSRIAEIEVPDPSRRVLFLIASSWKSREWPSEHFANFAVQLEVRHQMVPVLIGAPSDAGKSLEIQQEIKGRVPILDLTGKTTLRELVVLCKRSFCGVGVDSGPMHIASAAGLPVISFWGSTSPERSTPFGNKEGVLQSPLGCSPCYFRECPGLGTLCLKSITPEIAGLKFEKLLEDMPNLKSIHPS
jgi:ADP-heptose:LPS heptosyltransferase